MKLFSVVVLFLLMHSESLAQCNRIHFVNSSLSFAYSKAQTEDKNVFIFIYDEGDAKTNFIESGIFYKPDICRLFNEKFINIKIKSKSMDAQDLIRRNRLEKFPAYLIIDKNRVVRHKTSSIQNSSDLMTFGRRMR